MWHGAKEVEGALSIGLREGASEGEGDGQAGTAVREHRERIDAQSEARARRSTQTDHPRGGQDGKGRAFVVMGDEALAAIEETVEVHRLTHKCGWAHRRDTAAGLAVALILRPPPVFVHQVVRQEVSESCICSDGNAFEFCKELGCVPGDGGQEVGAGQESVDPGRTPHGVHDPMHNVVNLSAKVLTLRPPSCPGVAGHGQDVGHVAQASGPPLASSMTRGWWTWPPTWGGQVAR